MRARAPRRSPQHGHERLKNRKDLAASASYASLPFTGVALSRDAFDAALVDAAVRAGREPDDIKINQGFTDQTFDEYNPEYHFH